MNRYEQRAADRDAQFALGAANRRPATIRPAITSDDTPLRRLLLAYLGEALDELPRAPLVWGLGIVLPAAVLALALVLAAV